MKKIEDVGLGDITVSDFGNNFSFELLSMYDGSSLGEIVCKNVKKIICENYTLDKDEGFSGVYIPLIVIKEVDDISDKEILGYLFERKKTKGFILTMGESEVSIRVVCLDIEVNVDPKYIQNN